MMICSYQSTVSKVTREFSKTESITVDHFHGRNGKEHLNQNHVGNSTPGSKSRGNVLGTRESDSGVSDEVSDNTQHGNTSVLELHISEAVELFLVSVGTDSQRIKKSEGSHGTELVVKGTSLEGGGLGGLLGRGKGSSRSDEGGKDSSLHVEIVIVDMGIGFTKKENGRGCCSKPPKTQELQRKF